MAKKISPADILLMAFCLVAAAALVWLYDHTGDEALRILLWPHAQAVALFYPLSMHYVPGTGYAASGGSFVIGTACMGVRFIALLFAMQSCMFLRRFGGIHKALWIAACLPCAAVIGVIASCVRIVASVPFVSNPKFATIHTGIGIALYLIVLVASFALVNKLSGVKRNEIQQ
jgi:exosortase K